MQWALVVILETASGQTGMVPMHNLYDDYERCVYEANVHRQMYLATSPDVNNKVYAWCVEVPREV